MKLLNKEDKTLRQVAEIVLPDEIKMDWVKELAEHMLSIMRETGAVGVAAPQIGVSKRIIVFGTLYTKRRKPEVEIPDTILINPEYRPLSDVKESGYEGCLNCEDLMGEVPRYSEIEYSGYDIYGNLITKQVTGLEARILQHEIDHLDGFLFFDRVEDKESLSTYEEYQKKAQK